MSQLWDVYSFAKKLFRITTGPTRPLIRNFSGVAAEGEVLLVLGRPGAGCSTLMRALANVHEPFVKIEGDVSYSTIPAHEAKESVFAFFPDDSRILLIGDTLYLQVL